MTGAVMRGLSSKVRGAASKVRKGDRRRGAFAMAVESLVIHGSYLTANRAAACALVSSERFASNGAHPVGGQTLRHAFLVCEMSRVSPQILLTQVMFSKNALTVIDRARARRERCARRSNSTTSPLRRAASRRRLQFIPTRVR